MADLRINMAQMDFAGLSENWLFRHAGERHWDALTDGLAIPSDALRDELGRRLYPTFIAVRTRYDRPLNKVAENARLTDTIGIAHFGRAFVRSEVTLKGDAHRFVLEMVTTFAARDRQGENALHRTLPAHDFGGISALAAPPVPLGEGRALRRREKAAHLIAGHRITLEGQGPGLRMPYEPSPYADFNGAGLLYFAAYPTIADTCELRLLVRYRQIDPRGWAGSASTLARDVFYHGNLDPGAELRVTLRTVRRVSGGCLLHTEFHAARDGRLLADIFTLKAASEALLDGLERVAEIPA